MIRSLRTLSKSQAGFTMVELLVAALIVVLLMAAVAEGLIGSAHFSADQRHRSQADELAQQDQERLRGLTSTELSQVTGQQRSITVDGTNYTITTTAQFISTSGSSSCTASGAGAAAYYRVVSSVNWTGNRRIPVVEESVITPAPDNLLTQVADQTGAPVSGVAVTASGPDSATATTSTDGCTAMAGLATGTYSLTLAKAGYIDPNGNVSPLTRSATVTSSGTATPTGGNPVVMAPAGAISVSFFAKNGSTTLGGQADTFSWFGAGASMQMPGPATYSTIASPPVTQLPASGQVQLFPFEYAGPSYTNNYQVWAGKCAQMQPPAGDDMITVGPGSSQTAVPIQEPAMNVLVTYGGTRVAPAHVKLSFTSTSGTSCSDSWYATVAANAATSANGSLASPGQPYVSSSTGKLSVCADYNSHNVTVSSLTNSNFSTPTAVTVPITSSSSSGTC